MPKKVCNKCGIEKEATVENFSPEKKGKFGVRAVCRDCKNKELREKRNAGIYPFTCTHCGKEYLAREKKYNKFCSRECSFEHFKTSEDVICECCGEIFRKTKKRKTNICTPCNQANIKKHKEQNEVKNLARNLLKELNKIIKHQEKINSKQEQIKERTKECLTCGTTFIGMNTLSSYCSTKCRNRAHNKKKELRKGKRALLINNNGAIDNDISLEKLIQRDNNTCYICGHTCDGTDYVVTEQGYYIHGNYYPSIDHVVAIANGGTHTWDNVLLAHRICNSIKSDKVIV